ncbi:hypothetical protein [Adlercreutzia sp. ZJ176]|uniref:hypothetical protein n=2 Tax=unclassified Adlercreutzia TaxID=2636013 RepID=UPI0013EB5DAE|nr:hypothetical protein [Adlercreutzia sp. ZJ176]
MRKMVKTMLNPTRFSGYPIGTLGVGEPTNSLSSAAKTSLDQQFYERRPEVLSCDSTYYTSPGFLSFGIFRAYRKPAFQVVAESPGLETAGRVISRETKDTVRFPTEISEEGRRKYSEKKRSPKHLEVMSGVLELKVAA